MMSPARSTRLGLLYGWLALCACACLDDKLAAMPVGAKTTFIANNSDFANYSDWMTFEQDVTDDHGGLAGKTTVYLNKLPPSGATAYPIGTIIVKTMQASDSDTFSIHAMAKRGNGFNPSGTRGWEFFELALNKKTSLPYYLWRGEDPPSGEQYQAILSKNAVSPSMTEQKCNGCHALPSFTDGTFGELAGLLQPHDE
jgi:hypothetical protein